MANTKRLYLILGALFAWALLSQITMSSQAVRRQLHTAEYVRMPYERVDMGLEVYRVRHEYQQSGLKPHDRLLSVNGQPIRGERQLEELTEHMPMGSTLHLTVLRPHSDGTSERISLSIPLMAHAIARFGWVFVIGLNVIFPVSCMLVGFYIALARVHDPLAWITMAMLTTFGHVAGGQISWDLPAMLEYPILIYQPFTQAWPFWLVLFALYFPVPFPFLRRSLAVVYVLASPFALLILVGAYMNIRGLTDLAALESLAHFFDRITVSILLLYTGYIVAFFVSLGRKKSMLPNSDARRRLNVMLVGCNLAVIPLFPVVLSEQGIIPHLPPWLTTLALLALLLFPATMAYVIIVQQAMDVRMVVRTGVKYAIASTGLRVLRVVLIICLVLITLHYLSDSTHAGQTLTISGIFLALIAGLQHILERVSEWMDRKFFREAYDAEVILTDLSNSVAGIRDVRQLVETVGKRIAASLHVDKIAMFLDRDGFFQPVYVSGFEQPPTIAIPRSASTLRLIRQMGNSPSRVYFDDPQSWVHGTPPSEQAVLQQLGAEVLLPVSLKSRLLGLISLGPKRSEAPYSRTDLQLLGAVASQAGLALENAELTENIRREIAQRERLDRELEIAREVQQRLFPQNLPTIQGLEFAGYCRPALGVGGDYYDFVRLPSGEVGIAVGDVSGKGIAAALMMASLQASLRGQVIKPCPSLSEMIGLVNKLVFDASAAHRYATFFYAQYEPVSRMLRYVNAGHNAPIILRRKGEALEPIRLETGGTVIGLFDNCEYEEGSICLEAGDLFIAFTDGVSEAQNPQDDEYGEDRLIAELQQCAWRSAAELISVLVDNVDTFTAGAPQHDDMTLVVMRLQ